MGVLAVVESMGAAPDPATAQTTPAASKVPLSGLDSKIDLGWIPTGETAETVALGDAPAAAQAAAEATAAAALAGHVAAADPHTQYALESALGNAAAKNVGSGSGDVAAGNAPVLAAQDPTNVQAAAVASAEVTAAPDHIWVLVGGALKRWTKAGFEAVVKALLPSTIEAGTATATPADTDILPSVSAAHTAQKSTWAQIKAALNTYFDKASTTVKGIMQFAADGGTTAGTAVQGNDSRLTSAPATWTPAPYLGVDADDGTYTISENYYTKNGKFCHAEFRITWTAKGTKTGALSFIYTPLASRSTQYMPVGQAIVFTGGVSITAAPIVVISGSRIYVHLQGAAATTAITSSNLSNTTDLKVVIDYIAA